MPEDRRLELLDLALRALSDGDIAALGTVIDSGVTSHVGPELANSGTWHGIEAFGAMIQAWLEPWQEISFELLEAELLGEQGMLARVKQRAVGAGSGVPVELAVIFAIHQVKDKVTLLGVLGDDRDRAIAWLDETRGRLRPIGERAGPSG